MNAEKGFSQNQERKESFTYTGVQGWGVTTSAWLFQPEKGLAIISQLNEERESRDQDLIGVELYATHLPPAIRKTLPQSAIRTLEKHIPPDLTPEKALALIKKFPNVPITEVHAEFNFSFWEEVYRTIIGEKFFPEVSDGGITDRVKLALKNRRDQVAWMLFFGRATQMEAVDIASYLNQESQGQYPNSSGTGLNLHTNIVEGFAQQGRLNSVKSQVARVLAEPERPYRSPIMRRLSHELNIKGEQLISDPATIREHIVFRYGLDGLTLGVDHQLAQGTDPTPSFRQVLDVVRNIHIAGGKGSRLHTAIDFDDPNTRAFLSSLFTSRHQHPIKLFLDLNPLEMGKLSPEEQFELIAATIDRLEDKQKASLDRLK
ncbi:MAG: hypothetical protein PHR64_03225 [Candidatus Shapirobacteria bacterium]|nr:hypothetical protein [Candidatus Shapirobacteria bacterium]MDD5073824.1 hypothetical protein [Candidatus Shapirobacteria bacterium]MDD5481921.1 hypothetical protein [Candidatus Shapirobacteria bacterium]